MDFIRIRKSPPLNGHVKVSGAKNAVLPAMAASLLTSDITNLYNVPMVDDVLVMMEVLKSCVSSVILGDNFLRIDNSNLNPKMIPDELVRRIRASFIIMGPLLATFGKVKIALPGGCPIGSRPIDLHLKGLSAMGAKIDMGYGYIEATCTNLLGKKIYLDFPSVGATENIMMAATLAKGETIIENAAEEPEIIDLADMLISMGANITGQGSGRVIINGVNSLHGVSHTIIPDRIEAGTYMVAAGITRGDVTVDNILPNHLKPIQAKLREAGLLVSEIDNDEKLSSIRVKYTGALLPVDIKTMPYPGFPTDLQSPMMALLCTAQGSSIVTETVFENRFMHIDELRRLGAEIKVEGRSALVYGHQHLQGTNVTATDLRAGAALVLGGLQADGITNVENIYHIDRGYEKMVEKLSGLGAKIERINNN